MDQLIKVIILALLQGVTELFPVSSLGHTVIIPAYLGWWKLTTSDAFLPIVTVLHLGTTVALLCFYWRDWVALIRAFFKTVFAGRLDADPQGKTIWLVIVGTIPIGVAGLLLQKPIENLFFSTQWPLLPASFLCLNGAVLYVAEALRKRSEPANMDRAKQEQLYGRIEDLTFLQAFLIGIAQIFALLPGISRSGITMVAGMRARLSHEEALRFAFLLLVPAIAAASLLEIPKLLKDGHDAIIDAAVGSVVAGVAAYISIRFLSRYFKVGRLTPFAFYCLGAGLISFLIFVPLSLGLINLPWA
ncbi:MAG TPA: undecaprenyl-diphosphate phosphatase [Ktedonobacterales bacterium]|nr:undecaprenyl-diphosphate phosphatase [Ktedonobacterales bacterium]